MENTPELTTQLFSIVGFASAGLILLVPILWILHWRSQPKKWLVHWGLVVALLAFAGAKFNSLTYVNRIEQDRSEEMAALAQKEEERKKKMEAERTEDVANIRFIEDDGNDFLDVGGMDETDLRLHGLTGPKLEKKERSANRVDNSLEGALQSGSSEEKEKQLSTEIIEEAVVEPIVMSQDDMMLANKLDGLLLKTCRWLIIFSLIYLFIDYLKRLNNYEDSYFPLPFPGSVVEAFGKVPGYRKLPQERRRTIFKELEGYARRNQPFLYFGEDPNVTEKIPASYDRFPWKQWPMEVLPLHHEGKPIHEDFIFEALWYGRSSFYSDNALEAKGVLMRLADLMTERKEARARTEQTVNIVWDISKPLSKDIKKLFSLLGPDTGFSLIQARTSNS